MNAWIPREVTLPAGTPTVGASQTDKAISKPYRITAGGALNCVIAVTTSNTTVAAGITAKLRSSVNAEGTFVDSKTVAITGDGTFYIKLQTNAAGDQTHLPLLSVGDVVITTGAGDTVDINKVEVLQED
jgi:hypothetical protein